MVRAESVAELFTSTRWTFDITRINLIPMNKLKYHQKRVSKGLKGFTLIELLVVISIIAVLAVLSFWGSSRFIENGRKVQALAQFRDFEVGMTMYVADYQKPPTPQSKKVSGQDTLYGDGKNSNQYLVSVLKGDDKNYSYDGESVSAKDANPRFETYITFPLVPDNKRVGGVGTDGKLYDPWGREIMVAINAFNGIDHPLVDFNNGQDDRRLYTGGLAEYKETKPKEQAYVFWSYGKDGKKGKGAAQVNAIVPYASSDDVISW